MLLSDKYTIYGDFDLKDNLCEYFNCKNIIFDFITGGNPYSKSAMSILNLGIFYFSPYSPLNFEG